MNFMSSVLLFLVIATPWMVAQTPDPYAGLRRYLGTWSYEGEGGGGKVTCQSQRRLIANGYFVESHRECLTPNGPITQVEVFGYSVEHRVYRYWGFNGRVVSTYAAASIGEVIVWVGEGISAGNRCTEMLSPGRKSSTDICEHSSDGGKTWVRLSGGTSRRTAW